MPPAREKRKTPRVQPYVAPCRVVAGPRRQPGYVTELSFEGARVSTEDPPPEPGSAVVLEVRLGRRIAPTRLQAEVKWVQAPMAGSGAAFVFGATFTDSAPDAKKRLQQALDEFRRRAEELLR